MRFVHAELIRGGGGTRENPRWDLCVYTENIRLYSARLSKFRYHDFRETLKDAAFAESLRAHQGLLFLRSPAQGPYASYKFPERATYRNGAITGTPAAKELMADLRYGTGVYGENSDQD